MALNMLVLEETTYSAGFRFWKSSNAPFLDIDGVKCRLVSELLSFLLTIVADSVIGGLLM